MNIKCKLAGILTLIFLSSSVALADGMVFEPIDAGSSNLPPLDESLPVNNNVTPQNNYSNTSSVANTFKKANNDENSVNLQLIENQKMQSALVDLDYSQVEIRNKLNELQKQYTDVDANYNKYKTLRKNLNKEVKSTQKRVKNLEKIKERIRKNMIDTTSYGSSSAYLAIKPKTQEIIANNLDSTKATLMNVTNTISDVPTAMPLEESVPAEFATSQNIESLEELSEIKTNNLQNEVIPENSILKQLSVVPINFAD